MDKSTIIKITEDKINSLEGAFFQDFCDRLLLRLYPSDYVPVRAGGPSGDDKNDGYCPKARIFFQAHASRRLNIYDQKKKIKDDLEGCLKKHADVKMWVFITNDTVLGVVETFIDNLRRLHPNVVIESWGHKVIADKIIKLPDESIDYVLDMNISNSSDILNRSEFLKSIENLKKLIKENKNGKIEAISSSSSRNESLGVRPGYVGQNFPSNLKDKSKDYRKAISIYRDNPSKENIDELKDIFYSSDDQEAVLQAILVLASIYKFSPVTMGDHNVMLDLGIQTAAGMRALDAEAILIGEKAQNISTQFLLIDLKGWGNIKMGEALGFPLISLEERNEVIEKLKLLNQEFNKLFKDALDKAMRSGNYIAVIRVLSMIGSAAGGRALHFLKTNVKERAEKEKKLCKSSFMSAKSIILQVNDKKELALLLYNFANSLRGIGEEKEALNLIDKAIKLGNENGVENFLEKAAYLRERILNPLPEPDLSEL